MAFETLLSFIAPPAVHAKPDVGRVNPDGQNRRDGRQQSKRKPSAEAFVSPSPNARGEIIGKVIDTTA